jgi:putative Mg2+ transporter-C (MgtC) family protein
MDVLLAELHASMPSTAEMVRAGLRLTFALLIGAAIGFQRELTGKSAGLRTHMLLALGTALVVAAGVESGMGEDARSRVIQGVLTGIGFLGAGAILKRADRQKIQGLTTAAGIWITAALGVAVGLGEFVTALIGLVFAMVVLTALHRLERRIEPHGGSGPDPGKGPRRRG